MKKCWKELGLAAVLGLVLPGVLLGVLVREPAAGQPESTETGAPKSGAMEERLQVILPDGAVEEMDLEDYLVGVVLREMPADFEPEAQKAQAVVARTYALRGRETGGKHENGAVCTDSACCQGYFPPEDYLKEGGTREKLEQVRKAVDATRGRVLTYDGKLIEATYFSCSGGRTEDAVAVWGADVPYLRATDSPGEEGATHFTDTVTFTGEEFARALGADLSGSPGSWLGEITYTDGGGVDTMEIGGTSYKGTQLRKLLGLRSTAITMTALGNSVVVTTRGFGHRVGMSQYGADAMAAAGSTCEEILAHYYQGAGLEMWNPGMD